MLNKSNSNGQIKVILVEDNELLSENISSYLKLKDIDVTVFGSSEDLEKEISNLSFDILILDVNLPGKNGIDYLKELRNRGETRYIIILTSQNTSDNIINGLISGADDYISKPFNFEEFVARIISLTRRQNKLETKVFTIFLEEEKRDLQIDLEYKTVKKDGVNIYLSSLEYKLLEFFVKNRGKFLDRALIYEEVWGEFDKYHLSRTVDVYIGYLRKKLGKELIKTKVGDGYVLY